MMELHVPTKHKGKEFQEGTTLVSVWQDAALAVEVSENYEFVTGLQDSVNNTTYDFLPRYGHSSKTVSPPYEPNAAAVCSTLIPPP